MSFFSFLKSTDSAFSQKMSYLSSYEVEKFFNKHSWSSVENAEEDIVERAILSGRNSSGKISIRKIYHILKKLENQRKISQTDRRVIMDKWKIYFK